MKSARRFDFTIVMAVTTAVAGSTSTNRTVRRVSDDRYQLHRPDDDLAELPDLAAPDKPPLIDARPHLA